MFQEKRLGIKLKLIEVSVGKNYNNTNKTVAMKKKNKKNK